MCPDEQVPIVIVEPVQIDGTPRSLAFGTKGNFPHGSGQDELLLLAARRGPDSMVAGRSVYRLFGT